MTWRSATGAAATAFGNGGKECPGATWAASITGSGAVAFGVGGGCDARAVCLSNLGEANVGEAATALGNGSTECSGATLFPSITGSGRVTVGCDGCAGARATNCLSTTGAAATAAGNGGRTVLRARFCSPDGFGIVCGSAVATWAGAGVTPRSSRGRSSRGRPPLGLPLGLPPVLAAGTSSICVNTE
jgi:hypothetical protein